MSEPKFTPLPWVDDPHDIDGDLKPINTRDKGWTKIRGSNGQCVVGDIDVSTPEGEANLRLILSAPELLACLEELLEWICSGYDASIYDIEEAARVVQKARGEA
jgi:hypothetical protein